MRIVWGRANSSNVMKLLWLLDELALPFERRDAGGAFGVTDTPEYRAMNPNGRVPVLQEDGFVLFESNAILRYLCTAHAPDSALWPRAPQPRAAVDCWMDWQQTTLTASMTTIQYGLYRTEPHKRDMAAIEASAATADRAWTLLDDRLGRGEGYVAGSGLTLADMAIGPLVHRWLQFPVRRTPIEAVEAWYRRLLERPVYRKRVAIAVT